MTHITYKGFEVPVIDEDSPRADILRYLRILEDRLGLSYDYVSGPEYHGLGLTGTPLQHDVPAEASFARFGMIPRYKTQAERVETLLKGYDTIGCLQTETRIYEGVRRKDESNTQTSKGE